MISLHLSRRTCALIEHLSLAAVCFLLIAGCGKSRKAVDNGPVSYDQTPEQTVAAIMALYDANKDGELDATELERCPSLKTLLTAMNKGPSGKITTQELTERIAQQQSSGHRVASIPCEVLLDGNGLGEVKVTLTPESFHGQRLPKFEATTGDDGSVRFNPEGGFVYGFYRVSISKQENGQETIPSRYNASSTLGVEVGPQTFGRAGIMKFDLKN